MGGGEVITGNMKILGLTGGIASGKSTVSRHLLGLGAAIIDTDRIAYELAMPHRPLWEAYLEHFGTGVLLPDNTLDRKAIGQRVFRDAMERRWVDDTAHPMIRKTVENQLETCKESGTSVAVLDVPLLFEVGWDSLAESVWVVYVPPAIQLSRLMLRDECDEISARNRIHSQLDMEEKRRRADVVIDNSGTWKETEKQVNDAWRSLNRER